MENIIKSIEQLIGSTPLLELVGMEKALHLQARILGKLEYLNPTGSVKDRAALFMLNDGIKRGLINKDTVIIEPTSGNTGIGLACIGAARGYKTIIVMPDSMSMERRQSMLAYGAELDLTPGKLGMQGAVDRAKELAKQYPNSFIPDQFGNPANAQAHRETTGPEIIRDTDGKVDILVAGVGTGGTVTGTGACLKAFNPKIQVVAVEPAGSPLLSGGKAGPHGLQGLGANFIPQVLDTSVYDEVIQVTEEDAYAAGRLAGTADGALVGISSGAALHAAKVLAERPENKGKNIVVILPDTGLRYFSTPMYQ